MDCSDVMNAANAPTYIYVLLFFKIYFLQMQMCKMTMKGLNTPTNISMCLSPAFSIHMFSYKLIIQSDVLHFKVVFYVSKWCFTFLNNATACLDQSHHFHNSCEDQQRMFCKMCLKNGFILFLTLLLY